MKRDEVELVILDFLENPKIIVHFDRKKNKFIKTPWSKHSPVNSLRAHGCPFRLHIRYHCLQRVLVALGSLVLEMLAGLHSEVVGWLFGSQSLLELAVFV